MRTLDRAIARFCYKHPKFGIPRLILYVIIGSAIVYVFNLMDTTNSFLYYLTFDPSYILRGQIWRLVTWIFIPYQSRIIYELLALYFYYFVGTTLESQWGPARFTLYYLLGVVIHIVFGFVIWAILGSFRFSMYSTLFSSYFLNFSMFFAFAALFPNHRVLLFFFIPIKIKWLAVVDALYFIYYIIILPFPLSLLPIVAVVNFLIFCSGTLFGYLAPLRARAGGNTVSFKREARRIRREQESAPYRHKCAVCGRTDADHPELEFRYCSKCEGYHCFCMDHINSHIHFKS
ncbi:MAG: hypothetical protein IKD79_00460 [Oscillospiraceae bacterium]|nr:hypothetical protein [Oscillospiraceae bacterium]